MITEKIQQATTAQRLSSIDFTRGLVIVIMALDHIRDLLHTTSLTQSPVDLTTTTPALFATRWITHLCAPIFVFLSGTSAFLMLKKQTNLPTMRRFLLTRGLWLIFLEITIVGFGFWSDIYYRTILFQVIFAIGSGFVILSTLIGFSSRLLGFLGLTIILLHNLLPAQPFQSTSVAGFLWSLFIQGGFYKLGAERALIIGYPSIPWLGIMLFGFGMGKTFECQAEKRQRLFILFGATAMVIFIGLRAFNLYGDPKPWQTQSMSLFSFLSFMNVTKYPPSLLYTAITLSVMFFVLALAEGKHNRFISFFVTYGRVPMFFYLLHWYIIHASMYVMIFIQGVTWEQTSFGIMHFGRPDSGVGLELPYIYLYWFSLILFMYPLCRWYGKYKAEHRHNKWLAYL